jgi:hypothetical protein
MVYLKDSLSIKTTVLYTNVEVYEDGTQATTTKGGLILCQIWY